MRHPHAFAHSNTSHNATCMLAMRDSQLCSMDKWQCHKYHGEGNTRSAT